MYCFIAYIKHLFTATNQHGVHSPFVYNYLTKCLYKKTKFNGPKKQRVLLKSIRYFKAEKLKIISQNIQIENSIYKELGLKTSLEQPFDLIYFDHPEEKIIDKYEEKVHNDSFILVANIHRTKSNNSIWKKLKNEKNVAVSIDLFHFGILFFRKEQAKQHFKIRI